MEEEENTLYFKSILDQQNDNIFDVIDSDNVSEFISAKEGLITQSSVVKKYRNKKKKPILLIYPLQNKKIGVFSFIVLFLYP